jgi:Glycosyltransferase family 9 (heptosyltransferase)
MALSSPTTAAANRVYVAPVSFGLGDLVVSLPAIQALIDSGVETWLVTRSSSQAALAERIAGLSGWIAEDAFDRDGHDGRLVDLRDHPLQRDHWWGSAEFEAAFGPLSINEILARICADFGIAADFTDPVPLSAEPRPDLSSTVLLVLDTDGPTKRWAADRWAAVAAGIRAIGLDVRAVTRVDVAVDLGVTRIEAAVAPTPGAAVDVLGSARAVVGVDTGLTHIAAQQRTPTVMICRANPVFFRSWPHTKAVIGDRCDDACVAVEEDYAYNERVDLRGFQWQPRHCPVGGRCLDGVRPEDVLGALEQVL